MKQKEKMSEQYRIRRGCVIHTDEQSELSCQKPLSITYQEVDKKMADAKGISLEEYHKNRKSGF